MTILSRTEAIKKVLTEAHTIAVLGAHVKESKPAYYVPRYLTRVGYEIHPVNPNYAGRTLFGRTIVASLAELKLPVDIVEVFRRSERLPSHLNDLLEMDPRPKVVWFQLGIEHDAVAKKLAEAGIDVIQNRCMLIDHQRLL